MVRLPVVLPLLTLTLASAVDAQEPDRGGTPFVGLFDALAGAWDRLFSWFGFQNAPRKHGSFIDPIGVIAPPEPELAAPQ